MTAEWQVPCTGPWQRWQDRVLCEDSLASSRVNGGAVSEPSFVLPPLRWMEQHPYPRAGSEEAQRGGLGLRLSPGGQVWREKEPRAGRPWMGEGSRQAPIQIPRVISRPRLPGPEWLSYVINRRGPHVNSQESNNRTLPYEGSSLPRRQGPLRGPGGQGPWSSTQGSWTTAASRGPGESC